MCYSMFSKYRPKSTEYYRIQREMMITIEMLLAFGLPSFDTVIHNYRKSFLCVGRKHNNDLDKLLRCVSPSAFLRVLLCIITRTWLRNSVRLSAWNVVHPTQPVEIFSNVSTPFCSLTVLWPSRKILRRSSQGSPSVGGETQEGFPNIATLEMSNAIFRKRCKIRPQVQLMANRKSYPLNPIPTLPLWTFWGDPNKGYVPPIWGTAYIYKVNRARKVKSDAQVATNKNSDPVQKFFIRRGWGGRYPRARKVILGLQVDIDKSIVADITLSGRWYIGDPVPHH